MREMTEQLYDFDDLLIEPAVLSSIRSRSEINVKNLYGYLPLMTAPMDTVVDENNFHLFSKHGILPVLPRVMNPSKDHFDVNMFLSYGLDDFKKMFLDTKIYVPDGSRIMALIDVANGHMRDLHEMTRRAKTLYGYSMCLMVGNVANPNTFKEYCSIGVDMVRVGIGNGGGCLTTVQTGVGYPMASLIKECNDIRKNGGFRAEIVADGVFKKYSDIIKALGLGADYVMLGSMLNKCLESAGETSRENYETVNQYSKETNEMFMADIPLYKNFRGMSTKEVQKSWGREDLKTSEGVVRRNEVNYTIESWVQNFGDYLRSAMSYSGKKELHHFIGGADFNFISQNSFKRFSK